MVLDGRLFYETPLDEHPMDEAGPELLTRLLDEHGAALVLYAQQWCTAPEDVVQEAFVRLMCQRPVPRKPGGVAVPRGAQRGNQCVACGRAAGPS